MSKKYTCAPRSAILKSDWKTAEGRRQTINNRRKGGGILFQEDKIIEGYRKARLLAGRLFFKDRFDFLQQLVVFYGFFNEFLDRQPGIVPVII